MNVTITRTHTLNPHNNKPCMHNFPYILLTHTYTPQLTNDYDFLYRSHLTVDYG